MNDLEWREHVKAAADRALRQVREDLNASPRHDNDVPYWPDTIIVHEGLAVGGHVNATYSARLRGWDGELRRDGQSPRSIFISMGICRPLQRRSATADDDQGGDATAKEGHYPDADSWFEMFGSLPELHRQGDALVYGPPRMALWEHAKLLDTKAEFRKIGADDLAEELETRAKQVRADRSGRW